MKKSNVMAAVAAVLVFTSCSIIRPGQIGMKQTLGKLKPRELQQGPHVFNPFLSQIIKISTRTVESYNQLPLPTKEGLSVDAQISLLYHVKPEKVRDVYTRFGRNFEEVIVLSNFRATAREVSARYYAKELYATEREKVEKVILDELSRHIDSLGFSVDAVLLKDIVMPDQLMQAIEQKVRSEQEALQMDFVIQKQQKEAERMRIEAEGVAKANNIINASLTEKIIQFQRIEMMKGLMNSPNSKVIITDGAGSTTVMPNLSDGK